jgi:hypothetical protein
MSREEQPQSVWVENWPDGVELRDLFAAFALGGIVAGIMGSPTANVPPDPMIAQHAYGIADAMCVERERER